MRKKVAVFGGTGCRDENTYFPIAYKTGELLAQAGFVTVTGAGPGMMDEALRGAHDGNGSTIGVALAIKERKKSQFAHEEYVFDKLNPRQDKLISLSDAYIAVPGGIGTLYEIMAVLALKRLDEIPRHKPMILISNYFQDLENLFCKIIDEGFVETGLHDLYTLVESPAEAIHVLKEHFHH